MSSQYHIKSKMRTCIKVNIFLMMSVAVLFGNAWGIDTCPKPPKFSWKDAVKPPFLGSFSFTTTHIPLAASSLTANASNTSGCGKALPSDNFYRPKAELYLEENMESVVEDSSRGRGESLNALAHLAGCSTEVWPEFRQKLQHHFNQLFFQTQTINVTAQPAEVWQNIQHQLRQSRRLHQHCSGIS